MNTHEEGHTERLPASLPALPPLAPPQVRFVGLETATVLLYLHSQAVLYRDLKPENLLLDGGGHVRLIDFGVSKQGDPSTGTPPQSSEMCGTSGYMAPEIYLVDKTKEPYSGKADWFSYGVCLYQLTECEMPFGDEPAYTNVDEEYRDPSLLDVATNHEIPHLYDFLSDLLDWNPSDRCGDEKVRDSPYWGLPDWELIEKGRYPSPMLPLLMHRKGSNDHTDDLAEASKSTKKTMKDVKKANVEAAQFAAKLAQESRESVAVHASEEGEASDVMSAARAEELQEKELLMNVDGWEFTSGHALAEEYILGAGNAISIL